MIEGDRVVHQARYAHPVPAVWDALTDPAALAAWLMPNDFVPTVGHHFQLDSGPNLGLIEGEVLDLDPPTLLRCRWTIEGVPTTVTIRLHAQGDETLLELEHTRLTLQARPHFDDGWDQKLQRDIGLVLSGERDPTRSQMVDGRYSFSELESERSQRAERAERENGGSDPT